MTTTDAELIAATRAGDTDAYQTLYEVHQPAARIVARRLVPGEAEDVVAEAFTRIFAALRAGHGPAEMFRPYLLTTIRNIVITRARRAGRELPVPADLPVPDHAESHADRTMIAAAFRRLPPRYADVLWRTDVDLTPAAEVAAELDVTPANLAAIRYRAHEQLKQEYLQQHVSARHPAAGKLGAYTRGKISGNAAVRVEQHLDGCGQCRTALTETTAVNRGLRLLIPVWLRAPAAATAVGAAVLVPAAVVHLHHPPPHHRVAAAAQPSASPSAQPAPVQHEQRAKRQPDGSSPPPAPVASASPKPAPSSSSPALKIDLPGPLPVHLKVSLPDPVTLLKHVGNVLTIP